MLVPRQRQFELRSLDTPKRLACNILVMPEGADSHESVKAARAQRQAVKAIRAVLASDRDIMVRHNAAGRKHFGVF